MNPAILIAGAAALAAYFYKDQLFGTTAGTAPAITAGKDAASKAAAAGATPAQQASAAAEAIKATPPALILPTIQVDNPTVHDALTVLSQTQSPTALAAALVRFRLDDTSYLLNVSQWNWYHAGSGVNQEGIITGPTEVGDNAIPASRYYELRKARGLV